MTKKNILGATMVFSPFVAILVKISTDIGFVNAIIGFAIASAITAVIGVGVYLMTS